MWSIGKYKFKSKVVLAPMAGITFLSYREFMKPFGVAYSVTEMISDAGLSFHNKKTIEYLNTSKLDSPIAIQIFGNNIESAKKAIDVINKEQKVKYDFLDINLACPVKKICGNNSGGSWLKDLKKLEKYISEIVKYSSKPVTTKIRIGIDDNHINVFDTVKVLEKCGVKAIAIHARTVKQLYSGKPQFEKIKNIGDTVNVPIIISGDIFTLEDAINAINITKAKAVMVARGGIGNPKLITKINKYYESNKIIKNSSIKEQISYCRKLSKAIIKEKGEKTGISILRGIAPKFFSSFENSKKYRVMLSSNIKTYQDLDLILKDISKSIK